MSTYRYEQGHRWTKVVDVATDTVLAFLDPATGEAYVALRAKEPNKRRPLDPAELAPMLAALPEQTRRAFEPRAFEPAEAPVEQPAEQPAVADEVADEDAPFAVGDAVIPVSPAYPYETLPGMVFDVARSPIAAGGWVVEVGYTIGTGSGDSGLGDIPGDAQVYPAGQLRRWSADEAGAGHPPGAAPAVPQQRSEQPAEPATAPAEAPQELAEWTVVGMIREADNELFVCGVFPGWSPELTTSDHAGGGFLRFAHCVTADTGAEAEELAVAYVADYQAMAGDVPA
jgi:hypothetical protein